MPEKEKKKCRFSIGGIVVSALLFLSVIGIIWVSNVREVDFPISAIFGYILAATVLLRRSFRPPVGFGRGLAIVVGGMLVGAAARTVEFAALGGPTGYRSQFPIDLFYLIVGVGLVWIGLKPIKKAAARAEIASQGLPDQTKEGKMRLFGPPDIEKFKTKRKILKLIALFSYEKDEKIQEASIQALVEIGEPAVDKIILTLNLRFPLEISTIS